MPLKIFTYPNPILRQKSRIISREEILRPEFKKLIKEMVEIMLKNDGVGLAAPQIGKNIRLIVVNLEDKPLACLNPVITRKSWRKNTAEEGCLSFPGVFKLIKRYTAVTVKFLNENGEKQILKVKDVPARIFQHEIDHLDGILFIDKIKK